MQWEALIWIKKSVVCYSSYDKLWYKGGETVILSPSEAPSNKMIHEMFTKATEQNGYNFSFRIDNHRE